MNTSPSCDENGSRHNRWWSYDNWGYGLVAVALEWVYQQHYEGILRQKFLSPLNLSRTVVDSSELRQGSNIAYPYVVLDNGTFHRSTSDKWTYQNHRPANAALGMRSCVRDMLSWALYVLESEKESKKEEAISITKKGTYGHSPTPLRPEMDDGQGHGRARTPSMIPRPIVWDGIKRRSPVRCSAFYHKTI
jgi:CubicO group peptidase (beta-lactamase class C family)